VDTLQRLMTDDGQDSWFVPQSAEISPRLSKGLLLQFDVQFVPNVVRPSRVSSASLANQSSAWATFTAPLSTKRQALRSLSPRVAMA